MRITEIVRFSLVGLALLACTSCFGPKRYQAITLLQVKAGRDVPAALAEIESIISARTPDGVTISTDGFVGNGRIHISAVGPSAKKTVAASTEVADAFVSRFAGKAQVTERAMTAQRLINK